MVDGLDSQEIDDVYERVQDVLDTAGLDVTFENVTNAMVQQRGLSSNLSNFADIVTTMGELLREQNQDIVKKIDLTDRFGGNIGNKLWSINKIRKELIQNARRTSAAIKKDERRDRGLNLTTEEIRLGRWTVSKLVRVLDLTLDEADNVMNRTR